MSRVIKALDNRKTALIVIFVLFFILSLLFPFSGDDWAWGSSLGIERLRAGFGNYNGRYLGNLLIILLSRSKILSAIFKSICFTVSCYIPSMLVKGKSVLYTLFALALLLITPRDVFVQSYTWTSGFTNYVPPIVIILLYLVLIKNIFESKPPIYKKTEVCYAFLFGFSACLFMENITLYALFLGGVVIIYCLVKFKKLYMVHASFFLAAVISSVIMFSNGAYRHIAENDDGYRSTAVDNGILHTLRVNSHVIVENFVYKNLAMYVIMCIFCVLINTAFLKRDCRKEFKILSCAVTLTNVVSLFVIVFKTRFDYWLIVPNIHHSSKFSLAVMLCVTGVFFASVLFETLLFVKNKAIRDKLVLMLLSTAVIIAPLFVVSPIGPRCFYCVYAVLCVYTVCLFEYLVKELNLSKGFTLSSLTAFAAVSLAAFIFLFSVYIPVYHYDSLRNEYAKKQSDNGCEVIYVCKLPYNSFVWCSDFKSDEWKNRYKLYYGINDNAEIKVISYNQLDKKIADSEI